MNYQELTSFLRETNTSPYIIERHRLPVNYMLNNVANTEDILFCFVCGPIYGSDWSLGLSAVVITPTKVVFAGTTSDFNNAISERTLDVEKVESISLHKGFLCDDLRIITAGQTIKCNYVGNKVPNCCDAIFARVKAAVDKAKQMKTSEKTNNAVSVADELKKFKELLDMGIITQEEFDAKKKHLLGL
ncbi:MAG: SHOCT domain-containing protein [bacterium]|nr:SHOCT domain-containing protein [bacterium]